eukprot:SAG22_NODE_1378_length_4547_cov_77.305755_3_plen_363_part_00
MCCAGGGGGEPSQAEDLRIIHGLQNASQYNDQMCTVQRYIEERGRFEVSVNGTSINIRPENLRGLSSVEHALREWIASGMDYLMNAGLTFPLSTEDFEFVEGIRTISDVTLTSIMQQDIAQAVQRRDQRREHLSEEDRRQELISDIMTMHTIRNGADSDEESDNDEESDEVFSDEDMRTGYTNTPPDYDRILAALRANDRGILQEEGIICICVRLSGVPELLYLIPEMVPGREGDFENGVTATPRDDAVRFYVQKILAVRKGKGKGKGKGKPAPPPEIVEQLAHSSSEDSIDGGQELRVYGDERYLRLEGHGFINMRTGEPISEEDLQLRHGKGKGKGKGKPAPPPTYEAATAPAGKSTPPF